MTQVSVAQDGISKLLAAEQEAQKIVTAARKSAPPPCDPTAEHPRLPRSSCILMVDFGSEYLHSNMMTLLLTFLRYGPRSKERSTKAS